MHPLPFSIELIRFLADHRTDLLTPLFQLFTFIGEIEGYVLLIALIYVTVDKGLAFRLAVLTLIAMALNHFLKTLIRNPRPFIAEGTHFERWAVSAEKAKDLATEFSTPSGHGMSGAAFYVYLYASVKQRWVRVACVVLLLLSGLSRPYLGVHFLEDVLIGWVLGALLALFAIRYAESIENAWKQHSHGRQVAIAAAASFVLWLVTRALEDSSTAGQPSAFVSYAGFLTGILAAYPLEIQRVGFDPRSSTLPIKALRYGLSVGMILGTLLLLDRGFEAISVDDSPLGDLLRYVRYALAGIVGILAAPMLFVKLRLAEQIAKA